MDGLSTLGSAGERMIRRLRRFLSAVHENRTLRVINETQNLCIQKQDATITLQLRVIQMLKDDLAVVATDRDALYDWKLKAILLGQAVRETDKKPIVLH